MASRDGNGWVRCELGHRHWGRYGAAGLLAYVAGGGPVLLQQRTWWSHHGGTWGMPGGARDSHESVLSAALREAAEECGVPPELVRPRGIFSDDHGGWSYATVLAQAAGAFEVESDYDETEDVAWVRPQEVTRLNLHPGFAEHWPELRDCLEPLTIIVDGANVVGSRPDGWWRDRVGAAVRLRDQLEPLALDGLARLPGEPVEEAATPGPAEPHARAPGAAGSAQSPASPGSPVSPVAHPGLEESPQRRGGRRRSATLRMTWLPDVVLVVEGAARPAADANGSGGRVRVVAASGSGDDAIVKLAEQTSGRRIVVTADRELRRQCEAAGALVAGPSWLLGLL
jgi:8-oxo-dGTP diphosphatase